jgi:hypothetical protein
VNRQPLIPQTEPPVVGWLRRRRWILAGGSLAVCVTSVIQVRMPVIVPLAPTAAAVFAAARYRRAFLTLARHRAGQGEAARFEPDARLRIGDTERDVVADALHEHYSAGRLDSGEHEARVDAALAAKTGADLAELLADLPPLRSRR